MLKSACHLSWSHTGCACTGGYLNYVFRAAAAQLFGERLPPGPLPLRALRNADFQEAVLQREGRPVLRFALAYGFRNIQTLVLALCRSPGVRARKQAPPVTVDFADSAFVQYNVVHAVQRAV